MISKLFIPRATFSNEYKGHSILQTSETGKDRKTKILLTFLPAGCIFSEIHKEVTQKQ